MPAGRPSKYTQEIIDKAYFYIENHLTECEDLIPSHAGMAVYLDVGKSTLYDWSNTEGNEFSDILRKCNERQENRLLNGGLSGDFNAAITKLALGKQGYSEKIENDNHHIVQTHEDWLNSLD